MISMGFLKKMRVLENTFLPGILLAILILNSQIKFLDNSYINYYDELVHANVAVNSTGWSLLPKLRPEAIFPTDLKEWDFKYTWLHLGPSPFILGGNVMKIAGNFDISILRIISLVLFNFTAVLTYCLGRAIFDSKVKAFFAALLLLTNPFSYLLISGLQFGDIVDITLEFLNTFSLLMFMLYFKNKKFMYFILGITATVLGFYTKYALGLIPFASFILVSLSRDIYNKSFQVKKYFKYFLIFFIFITPYSIYLFSVDKHEFIYEIFKVQLSHIGANFEGWARPWDTHLSVYLKLIYSPVLLLILLLSLIYGIKKLLKVKYNFLNSAVLLPLIDIVLLYLVITFATAKAPAFGYSITPIVMVFISGFIMNIRDWKISLSAMLVTTLYNSLFRINVISLYYDIFHFFDINYNSDLYSNIFLPKADDSLLNGFIVRNGSMILLVILFALTYLIFIFFTRIVNLLFPSQVLRANLKKNLIILLNTCLICILVFITFNLSTTVFNFELNNPIVKSLGIKISQDFPDNKVVFFTASRETSLNLMFWSRKNFYDLSFLTESNKQIISNYKRQGYRFYTINVSKTNKSSYNSGNNCLPYYYSSICQL